MHSIDACLGSSLPATLRHKHRSSTRPLSPSPRNCMWLRVLLSLVDAAGTVQPGRRRPAHGCSSVVTLKFCGRGIIESDFPREAVAKLDVRLLVFCVPTPEKLLCNKNLLRISKRYYPWEKRPASRRKEFPHLRCDPLHVLQDSIRRKHSTIRPSFDPRSSVQKNPAVHSRRWVKLHRSAPVCNIYNMINEQRR